MLPIWRRIPLIEVKSVLQEATFFPWSEGSGSVMVFNVCVQNFWALVWIAREPGGVTAKFQKRNFLECSRKKAVNVYLPKCLSFSTVGSDSATQNSTEPVTEVCFKRWSLGDWSLSFRCKKKGIIYLLKYLRNTEG